MQGGQHFIFWKFGLGKIPLSPLTMIQECQGEHNNAERLRNQPKYIEKENMLERDAERAVVGKHLKSP